MDTSKDEAIAARLRAAGWTVTPPVVRDSNADAARWQWWRKWYCDPKDDSERINSLHFEGDDPAAYDAAVDAEIERDARPSGSSVG